MTAPSPTALRRRVDRLLRRLGVADDDASPRALAVVVALRDGLGAREALDRLGLDTAALDAPPPPAASPFRSLPPGAPFAHNHLVWTKATLDDAYHLVGSVGLRRRVADAYVRASTQGRGVANAYARDPGAPGGFVAARFADDTPVVPSPVAAGPGEVPADM